MRFIFTCGGTAGHINPALAVASSLRELLPSCDILFIGAENMMEMDLVPLEGYDIKGIKITNISRSFSIEGIKHNIDTFKNVVKSTKEAQKIISDFKPDCVIGTGGYVCYPVISAAHSLGIKTVIHESNAFPGLTTNLLKKKVDLLLTGFDTDAYSDMSNVICTGTPVRDSFSSFNKDTVKKELGIEKPLVLSVMGSLGSEHMNEIMKELIPMNSKNGAFHLIHVTGSRYYRDFTPKTFDNTTVFEYLNDIAKYMVAADLVICRAGASTLSELTYLGKSAILVPSPNVTGNHQEKNARALEEKGAAKVLLENEFDAQELYNIITDLILDKNSLNAMSEASKKQSIESSAADIAGIIINLVN